MNYNYGAILDYNPKYFKSAMEYFNGENHNLAEIFQKIEEKHLGIQDSFDIFHPNITFRIGSYLFNKDTYTLEITRNISLRGNNTVFSFGKTKINSVSTDLTVLHSLEPEKGIGYLDKIFLSKTKNSHEVNWLYDLSADGFQFEQGHVFDAFNILPYLVASSIFYKKVDEYFDDLYVSAHNITDNRSIVNKVTSEREINNRSSPTVTCDTNSAIGDSFHINDSELNLSLAVAMTSKLFAFTKAYIFTDMSPVSFDYMEENFLLKNLSNAYSFYIMEEEYLDREEEELVSITNFGYKREDILPSSTEFLDDSYYVEISGGSNALTFKQLFFILSEKLSAFYAQQLKLFLNGYVNDGVLGELIKYILDKIAELKSKFVFNDECEKLPLNNIDEGCLIECNTLTLDEPHLMVSKQKLKAIVRCSLSCERVL